jgi:hypothetical protein
VRRTALILIAGITLTTYAAETETAHSGWLYEFFSKGIQSAYAEYSLTIQPPANTSGNYYQQAGYSIEYSAAEKTYDFRFLHEYRDDWNTLTHNGAVQPPKQHLYFTGSRISPWTSSNGVGVYSEKYERKIQNWMVFEDLDSLLMMQAKAGNPLPPLSGIFYSDELKFLKKKYKESLEAGGESALCHGFDFDHNGNLTGISRSYLMAFTNRKTKTVKNLSDYTLSIRNNNDDVVFIDVLTTASVNSLVEGLQFKSGDHKCVVFNFEINQLFSKFAPELVADPHQLISVYLLALQSTSGKSFTRFESTASK